MAEQFWANDPVAQPKGEGVTFIPNPAAGLAQNDDRRADDANRRADAAEARAAEALSLIHI